MAYANLTLWAIFAFLTGAFLTPSTASLYLLLIPTVLGGFLFWLLTRLQGRLIVLLIIGFTFGSIYCSRYIHTHSVHVPDSGISTFEAVIISDVRGTNRGTRDMLVRGIPPAHGIFRVSAPSQGVLAYNDTVRITGSVRPPKRLIDDWRITARTIIVLSHGHGAQIKKLLFEIRNSFLHNLTHALPLREAALGAGLTIGDRAGFDQDLTNDMAASGTTHLVALSGYNIAIIVSSIGLILTGRFRRRTVALITVTIIILFVMLVGGEASIVRAAVMGSLMIMARDFGRMRSIHRAILLSAFCMCLANPTVIRQVGFQLSFMSLLGVVYLLPALKHFVKTEANPDALIDWKEHGLASIAAQAAVFPILLLTFDQLSLSGIIANVFIVATVPVAMLLSLLTGLTGWISGPLAHMVGWISFPILHYQIMMIHLFARVHIPFWFPNTLSAVLVYYAVVTHITVRHHILEHETTNLKTRTT